MALYLPGALLREKDNVIEFLNSAVSAHQQVARKQGFAIMKPWLRSGGCR